MSIASDPWNSPDVIYVKWLTNYSNDNKFLWPIVINLFLLPSFINIINIAIFIDDCFFIFKKVSYNPYIFYIPLF